MDIDDTIPVDHPHVACDGNGGSALGHPRIYLEIRDDRGEATCPYCSRHFVLNHGPLAEQDMEGAAGH